MLAESKHLSINLTPLLGFHYATSAITTGTDDNAADQSGRSIQFTLGANAAAELGFHSSGIPQLALQAQFGLQLRYASSTLGPEFRATGQLSTSSTRNNFGLGARARAETTPSATSSAARSASSTTSATRPRAELT